MDLTKIGLILACLLVGCRAAKEFKEEPPLPPCTCLDDPLINVQLTTEHGFEAERTIEAGSSYFPEYEHISEIKTKDRTFYGQRRTKKENEFLTAYDGWLTVNETFSVKLVHDNFVHDKSWLKAKIWHEINSERYLKSRELCPRHGRKKLD